MRVFDFETGAEVEGSEQINPQLFEIKDVKQYVSIDKYGRVFYRDKIIRLFV